MRAGRLGFLDGLTGGLGAGGGRIFLDLFIFSQKLRGAEGLDKLFGFLGLRCRDLDVYFEG